MKTIVINFKELSDTVDLMKKANAVYAELRLVPCTADAQDFLPAFLHIEGMDEEFMRTDYENIDAITRPEHIV